MRKTRGFTLLEILIALSVFAILATITAFAMQHAFNTRTRVTSQSDRLNSLQLTMTLVNRDTQQLMPRAILGNELHEFAAFIGQADYLEFTRGGALNTNTRTPSSTLVRVAYLCKNGSFIRRRWNTLDGPNRSNYQDTPLLDNVSECSFNYLTRDKQILPFWESYALRPDQKQEKLPTAIQLTLNLNDWGNMSLLFIIPGALYVT